MELVPIVYNFVAAGPALLEIVENGCARMELAGTLGVLLFIVVFKAAVANASFLTFGLHDKLILISIL